MFTKFDPKTKALGFGNTDEEAEEELQFHIARRDISLDASGYYLKRRQELYSWLPLPNLLTVKSIGSISYSNGFLYNSYTHECTVAEPKPLAHYLYLFSLFQGKIAYDDFTVTMSREINTFLANISNVFGTLDDFPYTKPGNVSDAYNIHYLKCGGFVCDTKTKEILVCDGEKILSVQLLDGVDKDCLIAYGLAKLGVVYNGQTAYTRW